MVSAPGAAAGALAGGALAVAAWHIGPAATWLPGLRTAYFPGLDGRGAPGRVALTFDDGPDPLSTPHFLRALEALRVRATFFVLGSRLERAPELGRRMVAAGHEVAVHGWEHDRPWLPRPGRDAAELARAAAAVRRITGRRPLWYRPPYGILTGGRWAAARRTGLRPVLWSAWGRDWTASATPDGVVAEAAARLGPGGTLLLHDSDAYAAPDSWRVTLAALPHLVAYCRGLGLEVGRLGDHGHPGSGVPYGFPGRAG
ncbi:MULTISPECIES: polysaccharide deacetylase family protein [unclassified Streptomyces]|uniref:polysaccharide deacetylase family protein n=1 Tax=unclassified Streptomyces TaxID=2593676 RepID=UPI00081D9090|nr:polysaccharide deacetylase family protein [Streptomyces sp. ScaeMP-6W]MYQ74236.1 polysaccharide deacetylase family protein [Streptomyces sp. SID4934]SCE38901.1 Peptidoglycan/xylan/chitin deacetylase, PgdA/CDA1 family [Streptomyces sp. ScaeMP-6W]